MKQRELQSIVSELQAANAVEDVFPEATDGQPEPLHRIRKRHRRLLKRIHPDRFSGDAGREALANEGSILLNLWLDRAVAMLGSASRSGSAVGQTVSSGVHHWTIKESLHAGAVADDFLAVHEGSGDRVVLRVCRSPVDSDLLDNERRALERMTSGCRPAEQRTFEPYLPSLQASFRLPDHRLVNVLEHRDGFVPLTDVLAAYPDGVDGRTLAWMLNRMLEVLSFSHRRGVVHGAVLPSRVWINPQTHGAQLRDWELSVCGTSAGWPRLAAVPPEYRGWYPPEVFERKPAQPGLDLHLAARTTVALAGGEPEERLFPPGFPGPIKDLLHGCLQQDPDKRFQDAFEVYRRLKDVLLKVYGPPRFHPFRMPQAAA